MRRAVYFAAFAVCLSTAPVSAQTAPKIPVAQIREELLALMSRQEIYYSQHNTYADDVAKLTGSTALPDVKLRISSDDLLHGYVAEATHPDLKDGSCVYWIGRVHGGIKTKRGSKVKEARSVVCDKTKRSSGGSNSLTQDEIDDSAASTMLSVIQTLRPAWLLKRGATSMGAPVVVKVYRDGMLLGGLDALSQMYAQSVAGAAYLSGIEATTRYGLDHGAGAIIITSRR